MPGIFLSYARGDDEPFVRRLYDDLTAAGFTIWYDRVSMPSRALTFLQEIRDAIASADRLLLVVGSKAAASDYVAAEWRCALELCIAVTPVLRLGDYGLVPPELSVHHCPDARPERAYADALVELQRILADPVLPLASLHGVPSLPAHFLPRPADLAFLDETVLADVRRPTVISSARQTTALQGMGGVGKSVLAAAFARSCSARRAFGDGIVWLTLGQQPGLLRVALALAAALGDDLAEYSDLQRARGRLPKLLADKKCLLVLDDAWDVSHAEPFANALGPRCRLLVTTRDGGLAGALGAQERRLDVLEPDAALSLLADWAGQPIAALPAEARAVVSECGYLPFALALCGAMARDGAPWTDLLNALREADLAFLQKQFPNYPYPDVLRALKVSVDALAASDPAWAKHYGELAVFPAGEAVPEATVVQLWMHTNGLNERAARQLLTTLGRKSLVRLEGQAPHRHAALHDLQHDYLRAALHDLTGLHAELLAAYREKCPEGWHAGPNDSYFFDRLTWHLARAGRATELRGLLLDYRWLRAKLGASGPAALIADYDVALDPAAPRGVEDETVGLVQGALRLSAHVLVRDTAQLPSQLTGRLLGFDDETIQALRTQARRETQGPWLRPLSQTMDAPGNALVRTLQGHTDWITVVALTPDGQLAISASEDKTLKVWDVASGTELRTLIGHASTVNAVALTLDGGLAISGSWDRTLKIWDVANGRELRTLEGHMWGIRAVALTPDGQLAVSASSDHTLKVWDVASGHELRTLEGHMWGIMAVALTPDGRLAISGSEDKTLKVWDVASGTELRTLQGHTGWVWSVAMTPDGRLAISASEDKTLKVWDVASGTELRTLEGHTGWVRTVALTPDGQLAISASEDKTLKVWDVASGTELRTLEGHTDWVRAVALTPDGRLAISASRDKTLKVWDVTSSCALASFQNGGPVGTPAVMPDGVNIIAGDEYGCLFVLSMENVESGPTVLTAWLRPAQPRIAFGCTHCRAWSEVPASALGTELPCPRCGKPVKLNPFVIEADWRPVAAAWKGNHE